MSILSLIIRVLSKRMMMNDKTIGLKPLLGLVLAFCQFCQGLGVSDKRVGTIRRGMSNMKGGV